MKKYLLIIVMGVVFFSQTVCFGGEEPFIFTEGFRKITWGTHKKDLPNLGLSKKALKKIYASGESSVFFMEGKGNLEMKFKSVPLLSLFLRFNNSVFYAVDMVFHEKYHQRIADLLVLETGTPGQISGSDREWIFEQVTIRLTNREVLIVASIE